MSFPSGLPGDIDALKAMLIAIEALINAQDQTLAERGGIIERKEGRIIRLETLLADFKRALYGATPEIPIIKSKRSPCRQSRSRPISGSMGGGLDD